MSNESPLKIIISGAKGRMGQAVKECAEADPENFEVAAGIDVGEKLEDVIAQADAVIDFSAPEALHTTVRLCVENGKRLVVGTTGHDEKQLKAARSGANNIGIVMAPNFSVGVNTLFWMTQKAAEILGEDYDLEVIEMHHHHKKDAPSGTARRLGEILAKARGLDYDTQTAHGREGLIGARPKDEIGMHSLRGGDVVGDHTVIYATNGERVELSHKASSRDAFAKGALRAAQWLGDRPNGLYDMQDVLGLR
jgi:4-hydroxy-tetrahydrodipicolinate reductase